MEQARAIIFEPIRVDAELFNLGLVREELSEVLDAARWGREHSTKYDPPGFAGWNQYGLGTRSLRMLLMENHGWTMSNQGNLCRTISPDGTMAIVVSSGSSETGDPARNPTTLNPKGKESLAGLRINRTQLNLFGTDDDPSHPWLWYLLINVRDDQVFGELSMPLDVDDNGRANDWLRRIIISPVDGDGPGGREQDDDDFDIDVVRRIG